LLILAQLASSSAEKPDVVRDREADTGWSGQLAGRTGIRPCGCHTTEGGGAAAGHVRRVPHRELRTYSVH
jgi:hypothetical protein